MSLSAKSATKTRAAIRDRYNKAEAMDEIRGYLEGCLSDRYWDLTQEEAQSIAERRQELGWNKTEKDFESLMDDLQKQGKSPGAKYIAARIFSGADPDLSQLTQDWFAHRNIKRALSAEELREIDARPMDLRRLGIKHQWEARAFYSLYRELMDRSRVWGSSCQINQGKVKAIATTPNYNRLPLWVKKAMLESQYWVETGDRIGNVWRLIPCAKAWKHAPALPKGIAEKVGKMSLKSRILARWAWEKAYRFCYWATFKTMNERGWHWDGTQIDRAEVVSAFWVELKRLHGLRLPQLIAERCDDCGKLSLEDHNALRNLAEIMLGLPHGYLLKEWGLHRYGWTEIYLQAIANHGNPEQVCLNLFGTAGKATVKAFRSASADAWKWASALCDSNPDAAQKILSLREVISYQPDAIDFLKSLPMISRIRLLQATTFKYRGMVQGISSDHVRDTGYLWKNIQQKPELGRIRCWFSAHEELAAAYVKELPDEALPIDSDWQRVDGLCAVDGSWSIEFPKRVATLKYYGEVLRNCVGGYGEAIKSGRSIVFVVREQGKLTHCVEVSRGCINQFYSYGNGYADSRLQNSVGQALYQAGLIGSY